MGHERSKSVDRVAKMKNSPFFKYLIQNPESNDQKFVPKFDGTPNNKHLDLYGWKNQRNYRVASQIVSPNRDSRDR